LTLKGAENLIVENKPVILFEQSANEIQNGSSVVIDYLSQLGYRFAVIQDRFYWGENRLLKILSFGIQSLIGHKLQLVDKCQFDPRWYDMIVAIPNEDK
jgi:hypothetical protein